MVNQHHALIFIKKKKGETIIGVLVKDYFYFLFYNYLVKVA